MGVSSHITKEQLKTASIEQLNSLNGKILSKFPNIRNAYHLGYINRGELEYLKLKWKAIWKEIQVELQRRFRQKQRRRYYLHTCLKKHFSVRLTISEKRIDIPVSVADILLQNKYVRELSTYYKYQVQYSID